MYEMVYTHDPRKIKRGYNQLKRQERLANRPHQRPKREETAPGFYNFTVTVNLTAAVTNVTYPEPAMLRDLSKNQVRRILRKAVCEAKSMGLPRYASQVGNEEDE